MATIAIIQPEGNFNTNPNLTAIINVLCDKGYHVNLYAPTLASDQTSSHERLRVHLQAPLGVKLAKAFSRQPWCRPLLAVLTWLQYRRCRADLVLGVDALGVIVAARLARRLGVPYALLSYELLFDEEVGARSRRQERQASDGVAFALVQDELRARHLFEQNGVPRSRCFLVPVAGAGLPATEPGWLRDYLGIPAGRKIAIAIGSTDAWTGFPALVKTLAAWPEDWCLVVHHRYGMREGLAHWADPKDLEQVYISTAVARTSAELGRVLGDADLGIAMYFPNHGSALTGRNLEHIGLASGKYTTFLQFGVPVMTNRTGEMAEQVRSHGLGEVVGSVAEVPTRLASLDAAAPEARQRCRDFFRDHLDVRQTGAAMFAEVDRLCGA